MNRWTKFWRHLKHRGLPVSGFCRCLCAAATDCADRGALSLTCLALLLYDLGNSADDAVTVNAAQ